MIFRYIPFYFRILVANFPIVTMYSIPSGYMLDFDPHQIVLYHYPPNQLNNFVWRFLSAMASRSIFSIWIPQFHHDVNKMMARKGNHFQMTLFQVGEWFWCILYHTLSRNGEQPTILGIHEDFLWHHFWTAPKRRISPLKSHTNNSCFRKIMNIPLNSSSKSPWNSWTNP